MGQSCGDLAEEYTPKRKQGQPYLKYSALITKGRLPADGSMHIYNGSIHIYKERNTGQDSLKYLQTSDLYVLLWMPSTIHPNSSSKK